MAGSSRLVDIVADEQVDFARSLASLSFPPPRHSTSTQLTQLDLSVRSASPRSLPSGQQLTLCLARTSSSPAAIPAFDRATTTAQYPHAPLEMAKQKTTERGASSPPSWRPLVAQADPPLLPPPRAAPATKPKGNGCVPHLSSALQQSSSS